MDEALNYIKKHLTISVLIASIALSFILYGNSIGGDFVYDDNSFQNRAELREPAHLAKIWNEPYTANRALGLYRPLATYSFALNFIILGESPISFHLINIFLNGIAIFLIFVLVYKLFDNKLLAIFTALIFAFFPIHTEAVASIKSRDELLAAVFALSSWIVFISATRNKKIEPKLIILSSILFLLAVLSKEFSIVLPALIASVYYIQHKPHVLKLTKIFSIFGAIAGFSMILRYSILGKFALGRDSLEFILNPIAYTDFLTRFWTAFKLAFLYIIKTFIPWNLSASYHYNQISLVNNPFNSLETWLGIVLLGALVFLVIYKKSRATALGIGAMTFLIPYLIFSKFIFKGGDFFAERWMYLPSLGLALIFGYVIYLIFKYNRWGSVIILGIILLAYTPFIFQRNSYWQNDRVLAESMIKDSPKSIQGYMNLVSYYANVEKDFKKARLYAEKANEIYPKHPPLLTNWGVILINEGKIPEAKKTILSAMVDRPDIATNYLLYAIILTEEGKYRESIEVFSKNDLVVPAGSVGNSADLALKKPALKIDSAAKYILAINYYKLGNMEAAIKYLEAPNMSDEQKIQYLRSLE